MYVNKGEENTTGAIFVMGTLIVMLLTVGIGSSMFSNINIQKETNKNPQKNFESRIADYADKCWRRSNQGSSLEEIDCFTFRINDTKDIKESNVEKVLEDLPEDNLNISKDFKQDKKFLSKVSYLPKESIIKISKLRDLE